MLAVVGVLLASAVARADSKTVLYHGSQNAEPASIKFQVGDRVTISALPTEIGSQVVGRSVRADGKIHYYVRTDTEKKKVSDSGCGFAWLGSCYEETHKKVYADQDVWNTRETRYASFLQLGPVLHFVTAAGTREFLLQGADSKAQNVLASGGYVYVALHEGEISLGKLVLPANSFDTGPEKATTEEERWGREWVQGTCAGKTECNVVGEPTLAATRGNIELHLIVDTNRP